MSQFVQLHVPIGFVVEEQLSGQVFVRRTDDLPSTDLDPGTGVIQPLSDGAAVAGLHGGGAGGMDQGAVNPLRSESRGRSQKLPE